MMNQEEQAAFIKGGFERLYRELEEGDPIYLKMCDVPPEMQAGPVDADGWCKWKLIPAPVPEAELDEMEQETGCGFPSLLRTFLSTYCHYFEDMGLGRQTPGEMFYSMDNAWNPTLSRAGYLPFAWDEEGYFIRCIDLLNMPDEDRCPVVQIDHEVLFGLDEDAGREELQPHLSVVAESFQAFLENIFFGWPLSRGRKLARRYISGLQEAYEDNDSGETWNAFAKAACGADAEALAKLREIYPALPASLEALLEFADGTYYREYRPGEKLRLCFLGSDLEEYPYYLLSAEQMLQTKEDFKQWGGYLINREFDDPVDERITHNMDRLHWLHFADCRNNGGSSQLFLDFSPSETGKAGQVVRYLHDPDELAVIADSFDAYLELLMENEYDFINEDTVED